MKAIVLFCDEEHIGLGSFPYVSVYLGVQGYGVEGRMGPLRAGKLYVGGSFNASGKQFKDSKLYN